MKLHDITALAGTEEHCPEFRAGLEELGWVVLGRVRLGTPEEIAELSAEYEPDFAPTMLANELVGATVLRDRDGTTFAFVDWFFRCPFTRLMTMLDDGRLVETHEAWTSDPVQQQDMKRIEVFMRRRREQTRLAARGRSIELVDVPGPAALVDAHRRHVARVMDESAAGPVQHVSLPQAMDLLDQQMRHGMAVGRRVGMLAGLVPVVPALVVCQALLALLPWRTEDGVAPLPLALVVLGSLATLVAVSRVVALPLLPPLMYVHALKPAFRGTVPLSR